MDAKAEKYLENNVIVKDFINKLNNEIKDFYTKNFPNLEPDTIDIVVGSKFIKLVKHHGKWNFGGSAWGFISRFNGVYKGENIYKGDLMKAASWKQPAKHSRGNIILGTECYNTYGPTYLT